MRVIDAAVASLTDEEPFTIDGADEDTLLSRAREDIVNDLTEIATELRSLPEATRDSVSVVLGSLLPQGYLRTQLAMFQGIESSSVFDRAASFAQNPITECVNQRTVISDLNDAADAIDLPKLDLAIGLAAIPAIPATGGASASVAARAAVVAARAMVALASAKLTYGVARAFAAFRVQVPRPASLGGSLLLDFSPATARAPHSQELGAFVYTVPLGSLGNEVAGVGATIFDALMLVRNPVTAAVSRFHGVAKATQLRLKQAAEKAGEYVIARSAKAAERNIDRLLRSRSPSRWTTLRQSIPVELIRHEPLTGSSWKLVWMVAPGDLSLVFQTTADVAQLTALRFQPEYAGEVPSEYLLCKPLPAQPNPDDGENSITLLPSNRRVSLSIPSITVRSSNVQQRVQIGIGLSNPLNASLNVGLAIEGLNLAPGVSFSIQPSTIQLGPGQSISSRSSSAPKLTVTIEPGVRPFTFARAVAARIGNVLQDCEIASGQLIGSGTQVGQSDFSILFRGAANRPSADVSLNGVIERVSWDPGSQSTSRYSLAPGPNELLIKMASGTGIALYTISQPIGSGSPVQFSYSTHRSLFFRVTHSPTTSPSNFYVRQAESVCQIVASLP